MSEKIYTELCRERAAKIIQWGGGKYEFENTFYDSVNVPVLDHALKLYS